ncbi:MAG TPA: Maf family protein [Oscillospiraceae bacterium]|nr:Maf family protein [Oscillospiraceae bacterium]HPS33652.1 Maf family protein [Oscillospiraceae bacterium]
MKLYLASGSPRRRELLTLAGIPFEVRPCNDPEETAAESPVHTVLDLSSHKARAVFEDIKYGSEESGFAVLGADTIVVIDDEIIGKPKDDEDARKILKKLSGRTHEVYTGVCLLARKKDKTREMAFCERTAVTMYEITDAELDAYLASGEHMDKAGAYAIQGLAVKFVRKVTGDYSNIVGLPVARVYHELIKLRVL